MLHGIPGSVINLIHVDQISPNIRSPAHLYPTSAYLVPNNLRPNPLLKYAIHCESKPVNVISAVRRTCAMGSQSYTRHDFAKTAENSSEASCLVQFYSMEVMIERTLICFLRCSSREAVSAPTVKSICGTSQDCPAWVDECELKIQGLMLNG